MGRKKLPQHRPTSAPVKHDPALLEAVRGALTALAAAREEATPSAIEGWIKTNRHEVWSSLTSANALRGAIETAKREAGDTLAGLPDERAAEPAGKKRRRLEPAPEPRPVRANSRPEAAPENGEGPVARPPRKAPNRKSPQESSDKATGADRPAAKQGGGRALAAADASPPAEVPGYDPTRSELLRVLAIAREHGGVAKVRKLIQAVKPLADQVGGLERLAVCLDTLEQFGVK